MTLRLLSRHWRPTLSPPVVSATAATLLCRRQSSQVEIDDLPPLPSDYDEFSLSAQDPAQLELRDDDVSVQSAVDDLLDELMAVRTRVLRGFAKNRGLKMNGKSALVLDLLDVAKKEALQPRHMAATRRVLGSAISDQLPESPIRQGWSNSSLEASMLEHACSRLIKGHGHNFAESVRVYSKQAGWISQRLSRMYQDDFQGTALAAVGGVFRSYKHAAETIVAHRPVNTIITAFSAFLCTRVSAASSTNLISINDVAAKMALHGLVRPAAADDDALHLLERMMDMLDDVSAEATARFQIYASTASLQWGKDTAPILKAQLDVVRKRNALWDLEGAPRWVTELVAQFSSWESLVRNDVDCLRRVPSSVFDAILLNVAALKALVMIHGTDSTRSSEDVPTGYRRLVYEELLAAFDGDQELCDDSVLKLNQYTRCAKGEKPKVTTALFEAILNQMQATLPDHDARLAPERLAITLSEFSNTAHRSEFTGSLHRLLVNLTEDMVFHLRFLPVYDRMTRKERLRLRTGNVYMLKTLEFFEKQHCLTPPDTKAVAFLCTILLYFALRPSGSMQPVLQRYASVTRREDLSICCFSEKSRDRLDGLKVAYPPQLSHVSWLQTDSTQKSNLYSVVPSHVVKSPTSSIMLASQAPIIAALDAISRVPWRVNKFMLHVQEAIVQEGYGFGKIRPGFYPLTYSRMKDGQVGELDDGEKLYNVADAKAYADQMDIDWRELQDTRSSRVHYLQALRQARALSNESSIFFPNNMDFRGRMYPLPGRLNHTGSDPFRALLEYAEPKPLGEEGLFWLKVHTANKMGQTKLSFIDRAKYVDDHINDVMDSARNPLKGDRWWQDADEPMQALMACKELADALSYSQGAAKYPSRLPVAVDGSYNGLQHYSAIGRDEHGAALVNLMPSDKPADAYTGILKEMMKSIIADGAADKEVALRCLGTGKGLDKNHIKRKTIKRPIMTQVYGVTSFGMSKQIEEELVNQNKAHGLWLPAEIKEMSQYLRDKIMESLGVTFSQTQKCREWLATVSTIIWACQPRDLKNAFMWTTPLGLIVRQPYRASKESHMFTATGYTKIMGSVLEPASAKQLTALAPNLIHSLDATHLAMTALEMKNRGLDMMAVHDSYWTHASDLPILSRVLREQFVDLYTNYDPLWELKEQWEEQFFMDLRRHAMRLPDPPERGKLDLQQVLKSEYFFS